MKVSVQTFHPWNRFAGIITQTPEAVMILERRISFAMNGIDYCTQGVQVRGRDENFVQSIFRCFNNRFKPIPPALRLNAPI